LEVIKPATAAVREGFTDEEGDEEVELLCTNVRKALELVDEDEDEGVDENELTVIVLLAHALDDPGSPGAGFSDRGTNPQRAVLRAASQATGNTTLRCNGPTIGCVTRPEIW
jgi:hypothetical protein